MAVRTFKAMTVGVTNNSDSYPYDVKSQNIRGIAVLATAGTGTITIQFKDGTSQTTPRIPTNIPYHTIYEEEIAYITSVSGITTYDIELLTMGVS